MPKDGKYLENTHRSPREFFIFRFLDNNCLKKGKLKLCSCTMLVKMKIGSDKLGYEVLFIDVHTNLIIKVKVTARKCDVYLFFQRDTTDKKRKHGELR